MSERRPERSGFLEQGEERIFWELFGGGERPAVCLLNGLAMHTRAWYGFLDELLPDFDVLLFDYLGQGESSCPDRPYRIPDFCHHLAGILDRVGIAAIHLVGLSYGGFVALDFGRLYPRRLHTLTLSGILLSRQRQFEMYQDLSLRFYHGGPQAFELYTRYLYEKIFGEAFLRRTAAADLEKMRLRFQERYEHRVHSLIRLTEAQDPFFDGLEERLEGYRAIRSPALVLCGEEDRVIAPRVQRQLTGVLPNSRFVLLEGSGHVVHMEKRQAFFSILRSFLASRSLELALPEEPSPGEGSTAETTDDRQGGLLR